MSAVIGSTMHSELKEMRRDRRLLWACAIALAEELSMHREKDWGEYQAGCDLWARMPAFHDDPPPLRGLSQHYVPAALLLSA